MRPARRRAPATTTMTPPAFTDSPTPVPAESFSALRPAGPAAGAIADLWWVLFGICTAVFLIVLLLLVVGLVRRRGAVAPGAPLGNRFVVISGIILPSLILVMILFFSLGTTVALRAPKESAFTVRVIGHQWWWEVHYPDLGITTANEIHIPTGVPVRLELTSQDVIHSFWVPSLAGKRDLVPGTINEHWIQADAPGAYRGPCAEFCGVQHALMALYVVALPPEEFRQWVDARRQPTPEPTTPLLQRGRQVFLTAGCGTCHIVRGTPAVGNAGPDLTHIGSRLTLGAGTVPNNEGYLSGWVSNPQPLKPGSKMPATHLEPQDLHALVQYLQTLE